MALRKLNAYFLDNSYYEKVLENGKETITDITDEIPFDIPPNWTWCRLGNVINLFNGYAFKSSEYSTTGIPVVRIGDLVNGNINLDSCVRVANNKEYSNYIIPYKALLLAMSGATTGKIAVNKHKESLYLNQRVGRIECIMVNEEYVVLFFNNIVTQNLKKAYGCAIPNLSSEQIKETLIPLPPLEEQKRIVEAIENLTNNISSIDEEYSLIEEKISLAKSKLLDLAIRGKLLPQDVNDEPASKLLERIRKGKESAQTTTKGKRKTADSYIFKGEDNLYYEKIGTETTCIQDEIPFDIPLNWAWTRLGNVADWNSGSTPNRNNKAYYDNGTIPWLKTGDLNDNFINFIPEYITEKALLETAVKLNRIGSVLIAMYGATIGKIGILNIESTTNQACCAGYCHKNLYNMFLFYFLLSQRENFKKRGEGGAQPNISKEKIIETLIPLPPLEEQKRIVDFITRANEQLDSMLNK